MKLNLEIDLTNDTREQISLAANFLQNITNAARRPSGAQPEVADNTGNVSTGLTLSPGAGVVTGASIPAAEAEPKDAPVVVKERKTRAKKEEPVTGAAPVGEPAGESTAAVAAPTTLTIDDVRTALQGFTAKNGVPVGITLLKEFGAQRISELKRDQFAAFIEKCNA